MSEKRSPGQVQTTADERGRYRVHPEWIGQATLINVGLIVLGIYLVSALVTVGTPDVASKIGLVSLVISMPLLAILAMLVQLQESRRYASYPWYMSVAQTIAQGTAIVGFGATLWHVWFPATIALVVSGLAAFSFIRLTIAASNATTNRIERGGRRTRGSNRRAGRAGLEWPPTPGPPSRRARSTLA